MQGQLDAQLTPGEETKRDDFDPDKTTIMIASIKRMVNDNAGNEAIHKILGCRPATIDKIRADMRKDKVLPKGNT